MCHFENHRMRAMLRNVCAFALSIGFVAFFSTGVSGQQAKSEKERLRVEQADALIQSTIETILKEHIEPPTRQQMVLDVLRQVGTSLSRPVSVELNTQISEARDREQLYAILSEQLDKMIGAEVPSSLILESMEASIGKLLKGGLEFDIRSNVLAQEQIAANRYVGVGVFVHEPNNGKGIRFGKIMEDGPAAVAGVLENDFLDSIDGTAVDGLSLSETVQLLRGPVESSVKVRVRTKDDAARELTLVRRVIPMKTLELVETNTQRHALLIKIDRIAASSLNELQNVVSKVEADGNRIETIVLDMQSPFVDNLHHLHLFVDGILDAGTFCKVQTRQGIQTLKTEDGKALDERNVILLYFPGQSEAMDLMAQACVDANLTVCFWLPRLNALGREKLWGQTVFSTFEAAGTDYMIKFANRQLLDKHGKLPSTQSKELIKRAGGLEDAKGRGVIKKEGSSLNLILDELSK